MHCLYDDDNNKLQPNSEIELETATIELIKRQNGKYKDEHITLLKQAYQDDTITLGYHEDE